MQVKQNFLVLQKRSLRKEFIICCCFLVSILIIMHISSKTFLAKDKLFLTLSGSSCCSCCSSLYCSQGKLRENFFCLLPFHTFEAFLFVTIINYYDHTNHENQETNLPKNSPPQFVFFSYHIFQLPSLQKYFL